MLEPLRLLIDAGIIGTILFTVANYVNYCANEVLVKSQLFDPRIGAWVLNPEDKCEGSLDGLATHYVNSMKVHGRASSPQHHACKQVMLLFSLCHNYSTRAKYNYATKRRQCNRGS